MIFIVNIGKHLFVEMQVTCFRFCMFGGVYMDFSGMSDEELIKLKRGRAKKALIGLVFNISGLLSVFYIGTDMAFVWFGICCFICFGFTIYVCVKNRPVEVELGRRNRQAISNNIHYFIPADCHTIVTVEKNTVGLKRGNYYMWKEYNELKFYPAWKVLDNPTEEIFSLAIQDIMYYETAGYTGFDSWGGAHDNRCLCVNMVRQQQLICAFRDYNIFRMVLPEKDAARINERMTLKEDKASSADDIMKYKKLLDEGIITSDEFEKKKRQLLGL